MKKFAAVGLAVVLSMSLSMTAFAASSSTSSNSSKKTEETTNSTTTTPANTPKPAAQVVKNTAPGAEVAPKQVQVAVKSSDGKATTVTLDKVVTETATEVKSVVAEISTIVAATTTANAVETQAQVAAKVQSLLTAPASQQFINTVKALAAAKGSNMVVNTMGTVKTAAVAKDASGNTIASAGVIKNVTSGALVMLMSVNEDGTIEYVEGVVDPVTGVVMGAFTGTPALITVLVLA